MSEKHVTLILDESGSMQSIKDDVIGGYNSYLETLKKDDDSIRFTLVKFDSEHQTIVHSAKPISEIPPLTNETYKPGALTPLLDATMKAIRDTEKHVDSATKVVVVIFTDGLENYSKEATFKDLNGLIKEKEAGKWLFTFLGVGINAFIDSEKMGIGARHSMSSARGQSIGTFNATARATNEYLNTGDRISSSYTIDERESVKPGSEE